MSDTLSIDLTIPFDSTSPASLTKWSKPDGAPILLWNALWPSADDSSFYNFGGVLSGAAKVANPPVNVWQHTPSANGGSYVSIQGSDSIASPTLSGVRPASALSAYGKGTGYMLGGWNGGLNVWAKGHTKPRVTVPGLLIYDTTANTWENISATEYSPQGTALNGRMHFLQDYGSSGLLVMLGGEFASLGPWYEQGSNLIPFTNITLYDPAQDTWYWQLATGARGDVDIPPAALMFCSVIATATNSGSVEIFIYGGHNDTFTQGRADDQPTSANIASAAAFNAVYVLSLPGFIWFRVNDTSAQPRTGHTCERIGTRSMISIGGLNPAQNFSDAVNATDTWYQGIGVFDMVNLSWTGTYDPNAPPYKVPDAVAAWYDNP